MSWRDISRLGTYPIERAVAEQFMISFGLERPPTTLADWVEATAELLHDGWDTMNHQQSHVDSATYHVAIDTSTYFAGSFFEALLVAFAEARSPTFSVITQPVGSSDTIEIRVSGEGSSGYPESAVMSFGVAADVVAPEYFDVPAHIAYHRFTPYTHLFEGPTAYQHWAEHADVCSMALSIPVAITLAEAVTLEW